MAAGHSRPPLNALPEQVASCVWSLSLAGPTATQTRTSHWVPKAKVKKNTLPKVLRVDWVLNVGRGRWVSLPKKIVSLNRHNSSLNPKEWPIRMSTVAEVWGVEWTEGVVSFQ